MALFMEPDIVGSIPNLLMKVELASHCKRQILDPNSRYGKSWILEKIKENWCINLKIKERYGSQDMAVF